MSVGKRISIAAVPLVLLVVLGVAACGGSSDSSGSGGSLSLVAYSTPQEAYEEIIPAFKKTDRRQGRRLQAVLRRLRRPGARGRGRPRTPTWSRCRWRPTSTSSSRRTRSPQDWNKDEYDGFVTNSVVVLAVRKGNPKNIKTWDDLIEGRRRGDHSPTRSPRAARSGTSWPPTAPSSRPGKSEQEAKEYLQAAVRATCPSRTRARARRCRRSSAARATCCSPTRTRRSPPSRRARRSTT